MHFSYLKGIAKRRGMIRWIDSGIYEFLEMRFHKILARGPATLPHFIVDTKLPLRCVEIDPKTPVPVGELLYPRGPIPAVVYHQNKVFRAKVEREAQKYRERIVRTIMEC